ncbi:MAG: hypothetical protein RR646_01795 [Erysipelotrichaceae bacterium]
MYYYYILAILILLLLSYISSKILKPRYNFNLSVLITLVFYSISLFMLLNVNNAFIIILLFILYNLYLLFLYKGTIRINLNIICVLALVIFSADLILTNFVSVVSVYSNLVIELCTSNIIIVFLVLLYVRLFNNLLGIRMNKYIICILMIMINNILYVSLNVALHSFIIDNNLLFFSFFNIFVFNISFIYLLHRSILSNSIKDIKETEAIKEEQAEKKFSLLEKKYDESYVYLHDVLHQCSHLFILSNSIENIELRDTIEKLFINTFNQFNNFFTNLTVVDLILNDHETTIKNYNINIRTRIEYNEFAFIKLIDQVYLFTYLFDLAMDACSEYTGERTIILKIKETNDHVIIVFIFSSAKDNKNVYINKLNEILIAYKPIIKDDYDKNKCINKLTITF